MMTKNVKTIIFFINMRILAKLSVGQLLLLLCLPTLISCTARREETPVIPPITSPLSREYIGFGVVTVSYTHVTSDPTNLGISLGYLRRGSMVRILRRQTINTSGSFISWVLIEENEQDWGWLREDVLTVYPSERQARTASELMIR